MGELIAFRPHARASERAPPAGAAIGATPPDIGQILLFTGVRYQRDDAPPAPSLNDLRPGPDTMGGAGGGRKRKRG